VGPKGPFSVALGQGVHSRPVARFKNEGAHKGNERYGALLRYLGGGWEIVDQLKVPYDTWWKGALPGTWKLESLIQGEESFWRVSSNRARSSSSLCSMDS
jgi:hypothetical protein